MVTKLDTMGNKLGYYLNSSKKILGNRVFLLLLLISILFIFSSYSYDPFLTELNLKSVLRNAATDSIVAVGMMVLLISGIFDLSVGSVAGLAGAIAGRLMYYNHMPVGLALVAAFIPVMLVGLINGFLIAKVKVNAFIVTLVMMGLVRGFVRLVVKTGISGLPDSFVRLSSTKFLGFRMPAWYLLFVVIIISVLVAKNSSFRKLFYIGTNPVAAEFGGINIIKIRIYSLMLMSGLAALAGLIVTSRIETALSSTGVGLEMRVITACFLGGASFRGGKGSIIGAVLGVFFIELINNSLIMANILSYWQGIVIGSILVITVVIDSWLTKDK